MAKVSIITISYNNAKGLKETIESVVMQDFDDYEYIVIDGGSSDDSKNILNHYSDHIAYWVSEPDNGVYHAMNKGIAAAKGEYLHFLNSGDKYAAKDILSKLFSQEYAEPLVRTVQVCDYGARQVDWNNLGDREVTLYDMYTNTMLHQATFIHRNLFDKYGLYDENLKIVSDWKFFLKAIVGGEKTIFVNIRSVIFEMNGISTTKSYGELHLEEREKVLQELMPPNTIPDYERLRKLEWFSGTTEFISVHPVYLMFFRTLKKIHKILRIK